MNEAINSLTSEMVRSCHMSSFYSKWRTNHEEDEAMVRALMAGSSSSGVAVAGRSSSGGRAGVPVTRRTATAQVTQRLLQSERGDSDRQTMTTTTTTTTRRTLIMVQNSDSGIVEDVADEPK